MSKLNEKQKAFADYYIESLNATESYAKAYECSYNTARTNGARLLAKANIKNYIDEVVKATIEVPKRVQWLVEVMEEVPKGNRSLRD